MKMNKSLLDTAFVASQTQHRQEHIKYIESQYNAIIYESSSAKKDRLKQALCVVCYNSGRCGGAAMTSRPCAKCDAEMKFGNTCTDTLCLECALKLKLCKHCGADIQLRIRRKLEIEE